MTQTAAFEQITYVKDKKHFFPAKIPAKHHQLRHLTSSPKQHVVYFVSDSDVFRLDTRTRRRNHIVELPFGAKCLTTGYGWLCVGGDKPGQFLAMRIPQDSPSMRRSNGVDSHEERLDQSLGSVAQEQSSPCHRSFGGDLTNSVTLSKMEWMRADGDHGSDIVAILTNNDNTLKLYALNERRLIWSETYDVPPNHASCSPDSMYMLVVGDKEVAYVYKRKPLTPETLPPGGKAVFPEWRLLREITLHKPPESEITPVAYFTTAWSDDNRLCATASEYGYVLVMDVKRFEQLDEDPVISIVQSSRPLQYPGAVRTMIFAPSPSDLLIWAEHGGRICIADLRSQLMSRQTIVLDPKDPSPEQSGLMIGRTVPNNSSVPDNDADRLDLERITRELAGPDFPNVPPLTHDEQNILRFLRTAREREPSQPETSTPPALSTPRTVVHSNGTRPRSTTTSNNRAAASSTQAVMDPARQTPAWLANTRAVASSTQAVMDPARQMPASERGTYRRSLGLLDIAGDDDPRVSSTLYDGLQPQRRRAIHNFDDDELPDLIPQSASRVVVPNGAPSTESSTRHLLSLVEGERAQARRRNQTARQTQEPTDESESLTSLGHSVRAREQVRALAQSAQNTDADYERLSAELRARRGGVLANSRRRQFEVLRDEPRLNGVVNSMTVTRYNDPAPRGMAMPPIREWGVGTTGLSMSSDGLSLYVGTEEGIFELEMDLQSRKFWPAIELN